MSTDESDFCNFQHPGGFFVNFKPVVDSHSYNPNNFFAAAQKPCIFFLVHRYFFVDKEIAELFKTSHSQRLKIVAFLPFADKQRKFKFFKIEAGNTRFPADFQIPGWQCFNGQINGLKQLYIARLKIIDLILFNLFFNNIQFFPVFNQPV